MWFFRIRYKSLKFNKEILILWRKITVLIIDFIDEFEIKMSIEKPFIFGLSLNQIYDF